MNTTYWLNQIMSDIYLTSGRQFYIGLSSTEPSADGTGISEPSGAGYARVALGALRKSIDGRVVNTNQIVFGMPSAVWFTADKPCTHYVLFDGNLADSKLIGSGKFTTPLIIKTNARLVIPSGLVKITLT